MKYNNKKKPKNNQQKRKGIRNDDSFFASEMKKKRKNDSNDHIIDSSEEEEEDSQLEDNNNNNGNGVFVNEEDQETVQEKRQRLAKAYIEKQKEILRKEKEDEDEDEDEKEYEKEGERDSLVVDKLLKAQLEDSGRLRRVIASRVEKLESVDGFEVLLKHRQSVTAVCLSDDDSKGFSASKDGIIKQWDVDTGKAQKYQWPNEEVLKLHGVKNPNGRATKHSKQVLALAVSTDGRYLASGGLDRHVHIWDTRTAQHIQAFPGHRGPVSSLTFRQGTSELFSGSFDRSIKIWSVDDRAYVNTLFGHQSEVLTVDCLRKERVLAAGRDRTMQMFKVPEESRLIFRSSASSLECCCFIDNDEFLSGSDDGNIELWGVQKKKPVYIVKNAHAVLADPKNLDQKDDTNLSNGRMACSWVSSVAVCRGSDLAASGAGNGFVRLWALDSAAKGIQPLFNLPLVGFVNSLAFAKSGRFLVAGVGQEPRLGRWGRVSDAQNGVAIQRLKLL